MDIVALNQSLFLTLVGMIVLFAFMGLLIVVIYAFQGAARRIFAGPKGGAQGGGAGAR